MNGAVLHAIGQLPRYEQFPDPVPAEGETLVHVSAAALKPVDKAMASGSHYASYREFPVVCGLDGAGFLDDGSRVLFAGPRRPYGAMAQRTVVPRSRCFPIPAGLDSDLAAALFNPGFSAWLSLTWRAQLAAGESVLILGATGVTGQLATQLAKLRGAGKVIAAGRNLEVLNTLPNLGADVLIHLDQPDPDLAAAFARHAQTGGIDVVIDYLWGAPTEALLAAITQTDLFSKSSRIRLIQVGESAGSTISLPAAALRSSGLEILGAGTGSIPPPDVMTDAFQQVMTYAIDGKLRIATERVPLADIESAWQRVLHGSRLLIVP